MGACPHLRGRERSRRKEAAAARDGRGSPSHQHTAPGDGSYTSSFSALGGVQQSRRSRLEDVAGGADPPAYTTVVRYNDDFQSA